jgi:GNAT superfamily N-acetyltransferase
MAGPEQMFGTPPFEGVKPEQPKKEEEAMKMQFETREGERFTVERLTSPEDPRVQEVQRMLSRRFGKEEVDPIEVMKQSMTGRMDTGEEVPRLLVNVVQDERGKVVALATGAAVELVDEKGNLSASKALLLDAYTIVPEKLRAKGVAEHLFQAREEAARKDAQSRGLEIAGYIVEDGGRDEEFYNRQGAKRVYIEKGKGMFVEVPYFQPPLDWDQKTGKPAGDAGTVAEHLMIKLFSGANRLSGEELMAMVRGMYYYNNYPGEDYFSSEKARLEHERFLHEVEKNLAAAVVGKTVRLFSREELEAMQAQGVKFIRHMADEENAELIAAKPSKSSYSSAGGPRSRTGESKRAAQKHSREMGER